MSDRSVVGCSFGEHVKHLGYVADRASFSDCMWLQPAVNSVRPLTATLFAGGGFSRWHLHPAGLSTGQSAIDTIAIRRAVSYRCCSHIHILCSMMLIDCTHNDAPLCVLFLSGVNLRCALSQCELECVCICLGVCFASASLGVCVCVFAWVCVSAWVCFV